MRRGRAARGALRVNARRDVAIVASGANLASLQFAFERLGVEPCVTVEAERVRTASHVVMPGVGAAVNGMSTLRAAGLDEVIRELTQPVLGICLGMQLLFEGSEEGDVACLGVLPGRARRLRAAAGAPVPHMGWNTLERVAETPLLEGVERGARAYFVHSYCVPVSSAARAVTAYGDERFSSMVACGNFFGVQFHPERSGAVGARILENFLRL